MRMTVVAAATALLLGTTALSAATPQAGEKLADQQTFTYRLLDEVPTFDPDLNEDVSGSHVIQQLMEGLTRQDDHGNVIPAGATDWTASDGNKVWTFNLRKDAVWSNGDPVTAQDYVYAWRRLVDPATASPYSWFIELGQVKGAADIIAGKAAPDTLGVEAVDDHTLKVTLENGIPYFAKMTVNVSLFPVNQKNVEKFGADWTKPGNMVTNGAYTLKERKLNEYFLLEKNPTYWNAKDVIITQIKGIIINDGDQALTRWEAGEYDMNDDLPAGQYPVLKAKYPDQTFSIPRLCNYFYWFNARSDASAALKDLNVRKALSYAIDRDVIVNQVLKGGQTAAYTFTPPVTAGFEPPEIDYGTWTQAERDAKAKELMDQAKKDGVIPDGGLNINLIYNTSENHKQIATIMAQMWKQKLGVNTTMSNYEWKTYLEIRRQGQFDVSRSAWCGDYNEASTFLDLLTTDNGSNDGKYSNPEVDKLMAESKTAADPEPMYTQVEKIAAADMPFIPIYDYANAFVLNSAVKGFPMHNVENNWYVQDFYRVAQ